MTTSHLTHVFASQLQEISNIAQVQEEREKEIARKYARLNISEGPGDTGEQDPKREEAAGKIQKTYRGHRARRELQGLTLDPTTRWIDALEAARYRNATDPKRHRTGATTPSSHDGAVGAVDGKGSAAGDIDAAAQAQRSLGARSNWHRIGNIVSHASGQLPGSDSYGHSTLAQHQPARSQSQTRKDGTVGGMSREEIEQGRNKVTKRGHKKKHKAPWAGKMMDLPYFLEMVDVKHRYGSNLRAYHAEWKKSDTRENFFYWLDYGEGKDVEIDAVNRETLEKEQVRYLSREERAAYLVNVDDQGRLVWAKNGERITTSTEYRDSMDGIVPLTSKAKMFREDEIKALSGHDRSNSESPSEEDASSASSPPNSATASPLSTPDDSEAERRYPDPPDLAKARGPAKFKHVSAHAILDRLLRKTVVKKNTWIFAFDTSENLYIGLKQSGSFQHSSFMRGSRISAAGTIKIKDGQIRALNPLSGHYRPPARAFRHFVRHLKAEHADMSRVSISKSYAVLVGLEMYISGRGKVKHAEQKISHGADLIVHPQKAHDRHERDEDHSQSAELERAHLREKRSALGRVLDDAKAKVELSWTAARDPGAIIATSQDGGGKGETAERDEAHDTIPHQQAVVEPDNARNNGGDYITKSGTCRAADTKEEEKSTLEAEPPHDMH